MQQSAADAAARREAAQAAAIPTAALLSPAAIAVTPEIQPRFREPEPNLDLSASPTLPYDSPDMQTDGSPAPFDTQVSYTNADSAAFAALNAQSLDFGDTAPASTSEDESPAQPDFPAAPAISTAEEPAAAAVGGIVKGTRGASNYQKNFIWSGNYPSCKLGVLKAKLHDAIIGAYFVFCCLAHVCRVCLMGCTQY